VNLITVNQQTCSQDGICAAVCPADLIDFSKGAFPTPVAAIDELCIRCGHCVAACPSSSLLHTELPLEQCPPVDQGLLLSEEQMTQFLRHRRSIRNYRNQPVPREILQKLIETARYAPTGHNTQGVEWLVLSDGEELKKLTAIVGEWMRWMLKSLPELALSLHIDKSLERLIGGYDVVLRDAPVLIIAHADKDDRMASVSSTIAMTYLELAATGMELGGCWAGYFNAAASTYPPLREALGLPEGHLSYAAMMIGYPQYRYHRLPERKEPAITWR